MGRAIRVGARNSRLSRYQAQRVIDMLRERGHNAEFVPVTTRGDIDRKTPLYAMRERGVFVKALEEALLEGHIDCAVHSAKDVPTELPEGCEIVAYLPRDDPRDFCACHASSVDTIKLNALVGTGSLRRQAFFKRFRPDFQFRPIRGNIETRIRKWQSGEFDVLLISASALSRLEYTLPGFHLDPKIFPPAPAQGVICIEARPDQFPVDIFRELNDDETEEAVTTERKILHTVGGVCTIPFGCYVHRANGYWECIALLIENNQSRYISCQASSTEELIRSVCHAFGE